MKPLYQGQLDAFCAIYAVLNALRLTHSMRSMKARDILNETLLLLSSNPESFKAFLYQETDYIALVDLILANQQKRLPLEIIKPFKPGQKPDKDEVWQTMQNWLGPKAEKNSGRAIVFRFLRYLDPAKAPLNRHWTTADSISDKNLHLFDCSHEAEAILNIGKDICVMNPDLVTREQPIYIQPDTIRLMRLPF